MRFHRAYLQPFMSLVEEMGVRRAVVLMGPRRVGKTVLVIETNYPTVLGIASLKHMMTLSDRERPQPDNLL